MRKALRLENLPDVEPLRPTEDFLRENPLASFRRRPFSSPYPSLFTYFTMLPGTAVSMASRRLPLVRVPSTLLRTVPTQVLVASRGYATPSGPPPKNFRLATPPRWDQEKESTFDRVGKYFLMTEMLRGMYVLLEQFFRPP